MSNSSLVSYTKISPNRYHPRNHVIDTITIHVVDGNLSVETIGNVFAPVSRKASSNYGIGSDGRIGLYVNEEDGSWCSSSKSNDMRAITIEVANDGGAPEYHVSDKAMSSLIKLCADICKRNNIKKLIWSNSKSDRVNHRNGCNMTVHRDFAAKACVPTYSEVLTKQGWVKISDIEIGDEIACADLDALRITFEEVYDKVPIKLQDTYTNNGLTATKDHRMVYRSQKQNEYRIDYYKNLLKQTTQRYIPLAGYSNFKGLSITDNMLKLLVAVQADGHYMYEIDKNNIKKYYGLEFHLKKPKKINRIKEILSNCHLDWKENHKSDGSVSIRIYNYDEVNIVTDICEKYLNNKCFTWEWLKLSHKQALIFMNELLLWDGCVTANSYYSKNTINLDIVNAIAALNGVGSRVIDNTVSFRDTPYITLSNEPNGTRRNIKAKDKRQTEVTCVSVKTGIFLMRQNGKTFIIGNCPGNYLYNKQGYIAAEVNKLLEQPSSTSVTIYNGLDYASVFDSEYYYGKYGDLQRAFGNDKEKLFNHFITYGMKEGRQAKADFNVGIYKNNYRDLQNAFGNDLPSYYRHYCIYGKNEKRNAKTDINAKPSTSVLVQNATTVYNGSDYKLIYDFNYYINKYADLKAAFGNDDVKTLQHFITYGMREGRQAKDTFNVINYKNRYLDLRNAFGDDLPSYFRHYIQFGYNEKRNAK